MLWLKPGSLIFRINRSMITRKTVLVQNLRVLLITALLLYFTTSIALAKNNIENLRLQVVEPFLELSTGPGRGYPLFFAVERGEWVEIIKSSSDWYEVRTRRGKTGWVMRAELEKTRTMTGSRITFPKAGEDDFNRRQWEFGIVTGMLDEDPLVGFRIGYFLSDGISTEFAFTHVPGEFSRSFISSVNILMQPYPDWRYSPYFSLGAGALQNEPKATLVGSEDSDSTVWNVAAGVRGYIGRSFMFRLEYRQHVAIGDDVDNDELQELNAGLSFFY